MSTRSDLAAELVLRPPASGRTVGWSVVAFGVVFGLSGLAAPSDVESLVVMVGAGAAFVGVGLSLATSRAIVTESGISYRNGLFRAQVPRRDVISFGVGRGSGTPPPRVAYLVQRRGRRRALRLLGVQRWDSDRARQEMAERAQVASRMLGLLERGDAA